MASSLSGKVAVITGGSTGIGLATAARFIADGARVYITGRNQDALDRAVAELGPQAVAVRSDVSVLSDLEALRDRIAAAETHIDVLFANAGIAENNGFGATPEALYDRIFDINVKGMFFTVQTLLPLMADGGSILLNASIVASKGMANLSLYNASKASVRSFARSWANDLRDRGIRVNAISPGVTRTPIMKTGLKMDDDAIAAFEAYVKTAAPLGRSADPSEIAAAAAFLASSEASYITGVELSVDGGLAQI